MARPTLYNEEILAKTKEYIDSCEDRNVIVETPNIYTVKDAVTGVVSQEVNTIKEVKHVVNIPTIEGLSYFLKVHKDTIYDWRKVHEEFSDLIGELLAKQANALINKGLKGDYNHTIAKVLLTKHGYTDKTELTGKDGKDLMPTPILPLNVIPEHNSNE